MADDFDFADLAAVATDSPLFWLVPGRSHGPPAGMKLDEPVSGGGSGASTDFGNVSQVMPSFALRFAVSEIPIPGHSLAMAEAAKTDLAQDSAILTAKALALTACDLLADPSLLAEARKEFQARAEV